MWPFSKKVSKTSTKPSAEELGAEFGKVIVAYVDKDCKSVQSNFLDVLQRQIDSTRQQCEHSPIILSQIEYKIFCDQLDTVREELSQRILASIMLEWSNVVSKFNLEDGVLKKAIQDRVKSQLSEAKLTGLEVLLENADVLKRADEKWRTNFPHLAAKEPLTSS